MEHAENVIISTVSNSENKEDTNRPTHSASDSITITDEMFSVIEIPKTTEQEMVSTIDKNSLEFMFRRTPYSIYSSRIGIEVKEAITALNELDIDAIVLTLSLADIEKKILTLIEQQNLTPLSLADGMILVDKKSDSSIAHAIRMVDKLFNQEAFLDKQVIFLWTHNDIFVSNHITFPSKFNRPKSVSKIRSFSGMYFQIMLVRRHHTSILRMSLNF